MILSDKNKFEFEIRNIGGSDVYYKRNVGDKLWLFSTKEEFELNKNIMDKKYSESAIKKGTEIEMEHAQTIKKFMRDDVSVKEVARAIAIDHLEESPTYYEDLKEEYSKGGGVDYSFYRHRGRKSGDEKLPEIFFIIKHSKAGELKLGNDFTHINNEYYVNNFDSFKKTINKLLEYLGSEESEHLLSDFNSEFTIEEVIYDGKSIDEKGKSLLKYKSIFKISAKKVKELKDKYRFADGGGVSDKIECHNPNCDWSWSVESGGDDLYVCHKCHTDNEKFYVKGGSLENDFEIEENEDGDRITISLKGIGEVILVQTSPQYEFIEDIDEDTLEELNVSEDDMIGKIEHLEVNDKFKGKGYAKSLMNKAIEIAEQYGWMPLYLNASPMGSKRYGLNIEDLTGFYETFGFKVFLEQGNNNLMLLNEKENFSKGGLIAPNGKPSNLTPEQYKLVRSEEFKKWFGDWENDLENSSKVIDEETKEPLVVYHGSNIDFNVFEKSKTNPYAEKQGYFFAISKKYAESYNSKYVKPFFINIRIKGTFDDDDNIVPFNADGNIVQGLQVEVYDKNNIKLADGSNSTFDANNPDIRFDGGGEVQDLISQGIVELKMFATKPEHAKEYGLDSINPLYVQSLNVNENKRLKGVGKKVLQYIDDYAIKNGHDVVFGHINQKATMKKDNRTGYFTEFTDIDFIKHWLFRNGYSVNQENNDFHKVVMSDSKDINDESKSDIRLDDRGKIQLNSNKGKVNLKLSSYEDVTELVPVSELLKLREFDRNERPKYSLEDSKDNISKLEKALIENGVEEPLIIEYSLEDNSVLLIEGNHRLNVAENLGFDYLPARVVLRRREFAPLQKTKALKVKGFTPDKYGYVPSDLKPSQVGIGGTTKAFEEGGVVEGQLHSECNEETGCGEKYDVGGVGHIIEVERDEAVIVSKAFQDNNQYEIKGTPSEIASALNVLGNGKNFDSGAEIKSEDGKKIEVAEIKKEAKNTDVETIDPNSIIINRRSMYDKEEYVAKGTPKEIASQINNLNDNGVKITDGGSIKKT